MDAQPTEREQRVTPLELFFDLVVVFAITQVTQFMSHDLTWRGIGHGLLVLAVRRGQRVRELLVGQVQEVREILEIRLVGSSSGVRLASSDQLTKTKSAKRREAGLV